MTVSLSLRLFLVIIPLILLFGCSKPHWKDFEGGIHLVLEIESSGSKPIDEKNALAISKILEKRIDVLGIKSKIIKRDGERRLVVQLPKVNNPSMLIALLSKSFLLEFKLIDDESPLAAELHITPFLDDENIVLKRYAAKIPENDNLLFGKVRNKETGMETKTAYLVKKQTLMTGESITEAKAMLDYRTKEPYVSVLFDTAGAKQFDLLTETYRGRRLAIIIDDKVYAAPIIRERITGGNAMIAGAFSMDECKDLAIVLMAGGYPAKTSLIESKELTRALWLGDGKNLP